jgi:hypothetical protein
LILRLPDASWSSTIVDQVRLFLDSQGYAFLQPSEGEVLCFAIGIPDVWHLGAGNAVALAIARTFDLIGAPAAARFDAFYTGRRSLERTREARRRQKERHTAA